MIPWPLVRYGAIVLAVGTVLWCLYQGIYDSGYDAGKAESLAFYQPIMDAIEKRAYEAEARVKALEAASAATNSRIESEDAQRAKQAEKQRDDAMRKLADMRVRLASAIASGGPVSALPECAGSSAPAPGESGHFAEADRRLAELAHGCQRDADRLVAWQDWYRQHAAVINQP